MSNKYVDKLIRFFDNHPLDSRRELDTYYSLSKEDNYYLVTYEKYLMKPLIGKVFNTTDLDYSGTYDFQFEITNVDIGFYKRNSNYDVQFIASDLTYIRIYFDVLPGGLVDIQGDYTTDINLNLINDSEYGWEVETEIKDIFRQFLLDSNEFFKNVNSDEIWEFYINYPT